MLRLSGSPLVPVAARAAADRAPLSRRVWVKRDDVLSLGGNKARKLFWLAQLGPLPPRYNQSAVLCASRWSTAAVALAELARVRRWQLTLVQDGSDDSSRAGLVAASPEVHIRHAGPADGSPEALAARLAGGALDGKRRLLVPRGGHCFLAALGMQMLARELVWQAESIPG